VYDVTRRDTFEHANSWLEEVLRFNTNPDVVLMLVGNKIDLVGSFFGSLIVINYISTDILTLFPSFSLPLSVASRSSVL